jgi:hypothetical protein
MTAPSLKKLQETFGLSDRDASLLRQLVACRDDGDALRSLIEDRCPATYQYARSCYSDPFDSELWRTTLVLHAIDCILETHGVEPLGPTDPRDGYAPAYEYCNMGDPYETTLMYSRRSDRLYIGCWGNLAERHPNW